MTRKFFRFIIVLCIFSLCSLFLFFHLFSTFTTRTFHKFTDSLFREEASSSTLTLHYTLQSPKSFGISDVPVCYDSVSPKTVSPQKYLEYLSSIDSSSLSLSDQITYDVLLLLFQQSAASWNFTGYAEPLGATIGIQAQLPVLLCEYSFASKDDILTYLRLLSTTDQYFSSLLAYEREKAAAGLFMPDSCADGIISQCLSFIEKDPKDHLLITVFNQKLQKLSFLSEKEKTFLQDENLKTVTNHVFPAYQLLAQGLRSLKKNCKNQMGLYYLPKGKAYYKYLVQSSTGSILSIPSIQNRIQTQLLNDAASCRKLLSQYPDLDQLTLSDLPSDPANILEDLQTHMTNDFPSAPQTTYSLKYVDQSLSDFLSPAFYLTAPIDNPDQNIIYLNPGAGYEGLDLYTTLAHEGYPGHLYQNLYSSAYLPPIRQLLNFGGYTEGWATYVEMISYSYAAEGKSDHEAAAIFLAQKQRSMMLGISSLLDIFIHYYGFTRDNVSHFLSELGISSKTAANSIYDAALESPANYLKYYLGYLTFLDLQAYCQQKWPDQFQLSDFHKRVLEIGPCQFPVLEKYLKLCYTDAL